MQLDLKGVIDRRSVFGGVMLAGGLASSALAAPIYDTAGQTSLGPGARFGWATFDMGIGRLAGVNSTLRLPMCSTFKWLLAACILQRVDAGQERLDQPVPFGPKDLLDYAPTTRAALKAAGGQTATLSVEALCEAAVTLSDNTAADLLLPRVGGPAGLTAWLRAQGDKVTRLDRTEPALNHGGPDELRDTTTAEAMIGDLRRILYGPVLKPASRQRLMDWMLGCKTGDTRFTAGLPAGWRVAQKTGTSDLGQIKPDGDFGKAGDVGALLPPTGAPILIAAYVAGSRRPAADVDRFFAFLARSTAETAINLRTTGRHG